MEKVASNWSLSLHRIVRFDDALCRERAESERPFALCP